MRSKKKAKTTAGNLSTSEMNYNLATIELINLHTWRIVILLNIRDFKKIWNLWFFKSIFKMRGWNKIKELMTFSTFFLIF